MKVTNELIKANILSEEYRKSDLQVDIVFCNITLRNGYIVTGKAYVNDSVIDYNPNEVAYLDAFGKAWQLYQFLAKEKEYQKKLEDVLSDVEYD